MTIVSLDFTRNFNQKQSIALHTLFLCHPSTGYRALKKQSTTQHANKNKNTTLEAFNFGLSVLPGRAPGKRVSYPFHFYLGQATWRATSLHIPTASCDRSPKIPPSVIDTCAAAA